MISNLLKETQIGIGLSSGTSADGIDTAIVKIDDSSGAIKIALLGFQKQLYPKEISILIKEIASGEKIEAAKITRLNYYLGGLFAEATLNLLKTVSFKKDNVDFIASHGQTICHQPTVDLFYGKDIRGTMQIGEPAVIAKRTGITTIADFRADDVAVGGEGAPLLPYIDYLIFASKNSSRLIQNIGGIANLAYIPKDSGPDELIAFDTGPGNMVIDQLCYVLSDGKLSYDKDGELAFNGKVSKKLLEKLMDDVFYKRKPPKSCGRLHFGKNYTNNLIRDAKKLGLGDDDIITTASMLTVETIMKAYNDFILSKSKKAIDELVLTGGGAFNRFIVDNLKKKLSTITEILSLESFGMTIESREAISFAILGFLTLQGKSGNLQNVTGAKRRVVLGKISNPN